jgi:hypothetical protein
MRFLAYFVVLLGAATSVPLNLLTRPGPGDYTVAERGGINDLTITKDNAFVGVSRPPSRNSGDGDISNVPELPVKLKNTNGGPISAYIIGKGPGDRAVFVLKDGTPFYPVSGGSVDPVPLTGGNPAISVLAGETVTVPLKFPLKSGRVYFAEKGFQIFIKKVDDTMDEVIMPDMCNQKDPNSDIKWGFSELTYTDEGVITANISFVDIVGLPMGAEVILSGGRNITVGGLPKGAVQMICSGLEDQQAKDTLPWTMLCVKDANNEALRIISPFKALSIKSFNDAFATYFDEYIDQVWARYRENDLTFNLQNGGNNQVACRVQDDGQMHCDDDPKPLPKPKTPDVWGCSGLFGEAAGENPTHRTVRPRLCAAFVRTTLLLEGGNLQPSLPESDYYTKDPTSHYSRIIHGVEQDGKGYAFPFDDVNPDGGKDVSGLVSASNATSLSFIVGGY